MDLLELIVKEFEIPVIGEEQRTWFFRTKAGLYFYDFWLNNYIALGWDRISSDLIRDTKGSNDSKKEQIEKLYPDESRPGLILGQMDTFYNKMQIGDLVVIPSKGSKSVALGRIGDFVDVIRHKQEEEDYPQCKFCHKRSVEWIKEVESWQDIYLFKALQGQQTISDLTQEARLVLRNLYPVYILGEKVHVTLQKKTDSEMSLANNADLLSGILGIADETSELYSVESFRQALVVKTAVGSAGIIEAILPCIPVSVISVGFLAYMLLGKAKAMDGSAVTGITAIITKTNELINDHYNRKKTVAETEKIHAEAKQIEAEARKADAEAKRIEAEARKTDAEAKKADAEASLVYVQAEKARVEAMLIKAQVEREKGQAYYVKPQNEKEERSAVGKEIRKIEAAYENLICANDEVVRLKARRIAEEGAKVCAAAARSDLSFNNKRVEEERWPYE